MGFFSSMYTKEGPGVRKDEPKKKGIARFFEILMRDYGALWKAGTLTFLCFLPAIAAILFGILFREYLGMLIIACAVYIASSLLIGPALTALHAVAVKAVRDIPGYMWHDYRKAFTGNARQSMPTGLVMMILLALDVYAVYFFLFNEQKMNLLMLAFVFFSIIVVVACSILMFLQILFIDLPLGAMVKNSVMLLFGFAKRTLPAALLVIAIFVLCGGFVVWPITVVLMLAGVPGITAMIADLWMWPVVDKVFKITEQQDAKREQELFGGKQ